MISRSEPAPRAAPRGLSSHDLLMLGMTVIWGINFTVLKLAFRSVSPLAFNALRFTIASLIMLAVLRLRGESFAVPRRDWPKVILLGICGHAFYQVVFVNGLARTTAGNSALLMATSPLFVALIGHLLGIERANRLVWAGILVSLTGTALLVLGGGAQVSLDNAHLLGDGLVLLAALVWATYTTASKPLLARYSPVKLTALTMVSGTVPLVLISLPDLARQDWAAAPPTVWLAMAYSAVFAVVMGYVIWYTSVQKVGNARTAIYSNLTPVIGVTIAWLALGDRLTPLQLAGAAVVLAGILLARRGRTR